MSPFFRPVVSVALTMLAPIYAFIGPTGASRKPHFVICRSKHSVIDGLDPNPALPVGAFVEFEEKGRRHMGRVRVMEHKINGGVRYMVHDVLHNEFNIADKQVSFSVPAPVNDKKALLEFDQLCAVLACSDQNLRERLNVSSDLLEMAWEETLGSSDHEAVVTPCSFFDLLHSYSADHVETYAVWRFLRTEIAHVFFKELKNHGRVVSFKAKDIKAVEAAKAAYCHSHPDGAEFCYVGDLLP